MDHATTVAKAANIRSDWKSAPGFEESGSVKRGD
jgi:hypothetical protein